MTINKIMEKLSKRNKGQYRILGNCIFLSVLLVSSFAFMYFSPAVQELLPKGGDSRKLSILMLGVTIVGCTIFTLYGGSLFFKYKSREFGIFLALGEQKKKMGRHLAKELASMITSYTVAGILTAIPVSYLIWKLYQVIVVSSGHIPYRLSPIGAAAGFLFAAFLVFCVSILGVRFIRRANIMDILNEQRKTEMVKEIKPWTGKLGALLIVLGLLLALGVPQITANVFMFLMPSAWNAVYLLCVAGLYLCMLSAVGHTKKGKHPEKYYKNMISVNLMRFTARQTTKNMCVITLLVFVLLISAFWGIMYYDSAYSSGDSLIFDYFLHYPAKEQQVSGQDIRKLADKHETEITDYEEIKCAELQIRFLQKDLSEQGKYYRKETEKLASFLSASDFEKISGIRKHPESGEYMTVVNTDFAENFWVNPDCLLKMQNPKTQEMMEPVYAGNVEFDDLVSISDPYTFILSDEDYGKMTEGLDDSQMQQITAFNVKDVMRTEAFAQELREEYLAHATEISNHYRLYDAYEEECANDAGESYSYGGEIELSTKNPQLMDEWKYAPVFRVLQRTEALQMIAVFVLLSIYIAIISLAAAGVMSYVRSITIAVDNRKLFDDMEKLGANVRYIDRVIKIQLRRIFSYPVTAGCGMSLLFTLLMLYFNDGRITAFEWKTLGAEGGLILLVAVFMYCVYRVSFRKMKKIIG